jgi:hypothetical protein
VTSGEPESVGSAKPAAARSSAEGSDPASAAGFTRVRSSAISDAGRAKLMFCSPSTRAEATPMTRPAVLSTGPPLLPCAMGAEICMTSIPLSRPIALTMPCENVPSYPRGLLITKTASPTPIRAGSPRGAAPMCGRR